MAFKPHGTVSSSKHEERIDDVIEEAINQAGNDEKPNVSWSTVRALGELEVLTRASYIMLILVPLLAGLWPGVKVIVNQYNDSVSTATQQLQLASETLEYRLNSNPEIIAAASPLNEVTKSLAENIVSVQKNIENVSIESDNMPDVWVWVFLSALAAILAHTAYQVGAPPIIQQASEREYINIRLDEEVKIQSTDNSQFEVNESDANLRDVVLAARREYVYSSKTRLPIAIVSLGLYWLSIMMIIIVIYTQTRNVLTVAGWI